MGEVHALDIYTVKATTRDSPRIFRLYGCKHSHAEESGLDGEDLIAARGNGIKVQHHVALPAAGITRHIHDMVAGAGQHQGWNKRHQHAMGPSEEEDRVPLVHCNMADVDKGSIVA